MTLRFVKDPDTRWYVDLVDYPLDRANLEMVAGADTLLDVLAQGQDSITLVISTTAVDGYQHLKRTKLHLLGAGGADYFAETIDSHKYDLKLWLCPVTLYVLGRYPKNIWYTVVGL